MRKIGLDINKIRNLQQGSQQVLKYKCSCGADIEITEKDKLKYNNKVFLKTCRNCFTEYSGDWKKELKKQGSL